MVKKWLWLGLLLILCNFCYLAISGQGMMATPVEPGDTISNRPEHSGHYLKPAALIMPAVFLIYAGLKPFVNGIQKLDNTVYSNIQTNHPGFHTNAEDYLMWAPSASIYFLDALRVEMKHNFTEHLGLEAGSIIVTGGIGYVMRLISNHIEVYETQHTKFPSGHTANAFRGAEILHQELKQSNNILSYSGYLVAASVGILRIYNKDHLLTEVMAGAGLGILSTKLTYWIFDKIKYRKTKPADH